MRPPAPVCLGLYTAMDGAALLRMWEHDEMWSFVEIHLAVTDMLNRARAVRDAVGALRHKYTQQELAAMGFGTLQPGFRRLHQVTGELVDVCHGTVVRPPPALCPRPVLFDETQQFLNQCHDREHQQPGHQRPAYTRRLVAQAPEHHWRLPKKADADSDTSRESDAGSLAATT